jgi:hypothetical protein
MLEINKEKDISKNTMAEKAIQEMEEKLVRLSPGSNPINGNALIKETNQLNGRAKHMHRDAWELLPERNQFAAVSLEKDDKHEINVLQKLQLKQTKPILTKNDDNISDKKYRKFYKSLIDSSNKNLKGRLNKIEKEFFKKGNHYEVLQKLLRLVNIAGCAVYKSFNDDGKEHLVVKHFNGHGIK